MSVVKKPIVGTPDRKYLWLLTRAATISDARYSPLVAKAKNLGFDVARLIRDPQR